MAAAMDLSSDCLQQSLSIRSLFFVNFGMGVFVVMFHLIPYLYLNEIIVISSPLLAVKWFCILHSVLQVATYALIVKKQNPSNKTGSKKSPWRNLCNKINGLLKYGLLYFSSILLFHMIAVLYGAPFSESVEETFKLSTLLATLTTLPCMCVIGLDADSWAQLFTHNRPVVGIESCLQQTTVMTLVGAWLGAFPIPLDWDRPWQ
ncbi:GPI ethanolamine phosphate transferase, stabilizing subunit-like, partial [Saccoglossus kowalevskii]|uniref:Phosphatidylinositol-glycan biosynthesis class F protein-like n=1 Tax=Saccoglossus kowalevskii TaxID=10224 RepID=A0ABM0MBU3_SACKO